MNTKTIISIVVVLAAILLLVFFIRMPDSSPLENNLDSSSLENNNVPLSTDVTNENNTSVPGTVLPGSAGTTVTAKLGQTITYGGVSGTVTELLEDSRCPFGAQCIQAGTVRIRVTLAYGPLNQDAALTLNQSLSMGGRSITLIDVKPAKVAGESIAPEGYVFTLLAK